MDRNEFLSQLDSYNYDFDIFDLLREGWEIFRVGLFNFFIFGIVTLGASILIARLFPESDFIQLIFQVLTLPLDLGYVFVALKILRGEPYTFNNFFDGYRIFSESLELIIKSFVFIFLGLIFFIIPGIYLAVSYTFATYIMVDRGIRPSDSLWISRKIVEQQWFKFFGLMMLLLAINLVGIVLAGVGMLLTIPFTTCVIAVAYQKVIGLEKVEEVY
jgi:uncharacterized membrane protein